MNEILVFDGIPMPSLERHVRASHNMDNEVIEVTTEFSDTLANRRHFSLFEICNPEWRLQYRDAYIITWNANLEEGEVAEMEIELKADEHRYL